MKSTRRPVPDGYVSIREAASILGCKPLTVYRMFERGQLHRLKDPMNEWNVFIEESEVRELADAKPIPV